MSIRPALADDATKIGVIAADTDLFPEDLLPGMIAGYLQRTTPDVWLVAEHAGAIIGFCFCEPERMTSGTWNMLALAVAPTLQGRGVGAALVREVETILHRQGERPLLVETMDVKAFERTRDFYRKQGFTEEARIRDFYEAGAGKVVFRKVI
ncbi:MAG: GNAT family N-acetyltransferase [Hyphomonadaceae bacterium]|nr:GNAT family N-acetyltransferase [Hyphomonadaceae bacterium]